MWRPWGIHGCRSIGAMSTTDVNHPVGILGLRDLFRAVSRGGTPELAELLHPAVFVPETVKISVALRQFHSGMSNWALWSMSTAMW
jgi:CBS domain containing-hemolysin-like protein